MSQWQQRKGTCGKRLDGYRGAKTPAEMLTLGGLKEDFYFGSFHGIITGPGASKYMQLTGQTVKPFGKHDPSYMYQQTPSGTSCKKRTEEQVMGAGASLALAYGSERERTSTFLSLDIERSMRYKTRKSNGTDEPKLDAMDVWCVCNGLVVAIVLG